MTSSSHSIQPALTSARSRRIVSGPASVGSKSERAHTSVADLTRQERRELDETFALALQGRRTKPRQSSSSSTEAPSAAELSVLLSDLRQESRSKRRVRSDGRHALERLASASSRQGIEQKSSDLAASVSASFAEFGSDGPGPSSTSDRRARRSSVSSVELSEVLSQILPKTHQQEAKLDGPEVLGTSPRKDHRRPPAPTRGRRSAPRSQKRDASPIPAVGRLRRDSSPSPNIVSQAPSAEPGRRRSSRSPAPPSIASAAAIVEQASMSQAGSCQVSSRRTSLDLDQISLGNEWKLPTQVQKGPATVEDTVADTRKLNELTAVPMSRSSSKQSAPASKGRYSRPSSVGGQSMISRPVESTQVARNLRRMMALTSSSDESDTTSVSSSLNNWRPSPRSLGPILGLRRWGYQQITANDRMQSETLPAPVTMNNGYNSSPETRLAQIRPDDAYTATRSRFPRIWPSSESDADVPATKGSTKPATLREQMKQPKHYGTDLEQGLSAENVPSGHWRAQSLPLKAPTRRSELPFHERPFPRTRRMTRTVASSTGYFSDNGASVSRPPTVTTMLPPPTGRVPRKVAASRTSHRSAAIQTRSAPTTPTKVVDEFSHMVLPPSFSPRPADGIPPYFPILSTAPDSSGRGWAKWLSRDSHGPQMASHMKAGEVRRSAKAEAAHRLGLGLPTPVTGASISASGDIRPRMGRTEANLAAAASSAAGSSAAARAYHMFAKRAYDKMGKTTSVPSRLDSNISRPNVNLEQSAQAGEYTKSRSAPAALAAAAVANDKAKQLDKTLAGLAVRYQDHSEPMSDEGMYLTPQLAYHDDPIPTDVPSDTDPNLSTPSEGMAPQAKIGKSSALAAPSAGTFRILRHFPVPEEKDVPSLRVVNAEKGNGAGDDEEYARLLFDWDGLDESPEDDDDMHDPEKPIKRSYSPWRMIMNLGGLFLTVSALLGLLAVLPIALRVITVWQEHHSPPPNITQVTVNGLENLRWTIIDSDTPRQAMHRMGGSDGKTQYNLVFSDEFNEENRSFERGMDPWWEAVDLWYWGTGDYERYDSRQVTTSGGALRIKLEERPLGGLNFRSGMLQSWNKLCMYGAGYLEVGVQLPGSANVSGLWPSVFTLGNLGRAGYGATLEGMWPYSYDSCDVGTLKNQTTTDGFPASAQTGGNTLYNRKHDTTAISFLPGQKLSACTCPQDDHPGPRLPGDDGQTYAVGRSVPEIDVFEAQVSYSGVMGVSQSVQMAPFNDLYQVSNSTGPAFTVFNNQSSPNGYNGEVTQQSISYVTPTIQGAVQHPGPNAATRAPDGAIQARPGYAVYGYELEPGPNGHLQWVAAGSPSWRMNAAAFDPDPISGIGRRVFSEEPMSIIMNLAISSAWSQPNWENLTFPAIMSIDYIRLYAPATADPNIAISCDPPNAPTTDYINRHAEAYNNPNLTIWGGMAENGGYEQTWPRNSLNPKGCKAPLSKYPGSPIDPIPKAPYVPASEIGV